jgi:hypothetical protein
VIEYCSRKFDDPETRYPAYDRELLAIRDAVVHWKCNLHGAAVPFTVYTDHATLRHILTQPHLTIRQMDALSVLQNYDYEVRHLPGAKNQAADALSRRPDHRREREGVPVIRARCQVMAELSHTADEWLADLRSEIAEDPYFEPILRILSDREADAPPPSASAEERKLWVRAKRYCLKEGLVFLKDKASPGPSREPSLSSPTDTDGMLRLCIPTSMTKRILHEAHHTPTGGHFGVDRTYMRLRGDFFWPRMWDSVRRYVEGCDMCHRINGRQGKPMGLLQPLPIAQGRWERVGVDFITDFPESASGNDCVVTFVDYLRPRLVRQRPLC